MTSPTEPIINTESQAARVAAIATTTDVTVRRLLTDFLMGRAEFFGMRDDDKVRRLLVVAGADVDMAEAIFATKMVEAV